MRQVRIITPEQFKVGYACRAPDGHVTMHPYQPHPDAPYGGKNRDGHYVVIDPRDPGIIAEHRHLVMPEINPKPPAEGK